MHKSNEHKWFTVKMLSNRVWYGLEMLVKDEKDSILFDGQNSQTQSDIYKPVLERWVKSIGVVDGKLVVTVI